MIVTVTANPALDLTYHLGSLAVGASQRVPPAEVRAGGKGINVARVLHAQGHQTHVVAPVGGLTGATLEADLDAAGLSHSLLSVEGATRGTVAIVTPSETTNLNETGAPLLAADWDRLYQLADAALDLGHLSPLRVGCAAPGTSADDVASDRKPGPPSTSRPVLVCSGSLPPEAPEDAVARMVATARERGARCVVDTSGPQLLAAADAGADVLKPNNHELLGVYGVDAAVATTRDVLDTARALAGRGSEETVVYVSLGAGGLMRVPADGPALHARLGRVLSGNTTGAGDAAVAAIAADLAAGVDDPQHTVRAATAWSAAAVLHPLAGSITEPAPLLAEITVTTVEG